MRQEVARRISAVDEMIQSATAKAFPTRVIKLGFSGEPTAACVRLFARRLIRYRVSIAMVE